MLFTIYKGSKPGSRDEFISQVKWLPGVGPRNAAKVWEGEGFTFSIPEEKRGIALQRIEMLKAVNMIQSEPMNNSIPTSTPQEAPTMTTTPANDAAALDALRKLLGSNTLDETRVIDLIRTHAARPATVHIDLTAPGFTLKGEALMHHKFPLLVAAVNAGVNVMMVGPAGSGKTTAAKKAADALNLPFYGTGAINSEYKLMGFVDAQGRIVNTAFRQAFEFGGVFMFDEYDGSLPGAVLPFNAATANDWCDFPDKVVKKHPDFRVIAGANTFGTGADRQYVGRNQLDAASLDRFATIDWPYDEALEAALMGAPAPVNSPVPVSIVPLSGDAAQTQAHRFLEYVRKVRKAVDDLKVRHVVSPRASIAGAKLMAAGWTWKDAEDSVIWKGMDKDTRLKVIAKL